MLSCVRFNKAVQWNISKELHEPNAVLYQTMYSMLYNFIYTNYNGILCTLHDIMILF